MENIINAKKFILGVIILFCFGSITLGQENKDNQIIYDLSDEFDDLIYQQMIVDSTFFMSDPVCFWSFRNDTLNIVLGSSRIVRERVIPTHRYLFTNGKLVPIYFYDDIVFSNRFNIEEEYDNVTVFDPGVIGGLHISYCGRYKSGRVISFSWVM